MSLSLEVKRFMNNEHMGRYVSVILPDGRPSGRYEAREAMRDRNAANGARNSAENSARAAAKARERVDNLSRLRKAKKAKLDGEEKTLDYIVEQQKKIRPELERRRADYEKALKLYEEKRNICEVKRESFEALEKSYFEAAEAEKAANLVLNDCRENASENGAENAGENAEASRLRLLAERARAEAMNAARIESEKSIRFNELNGAVSHLSAVMRSEKEHLADIKKSLAEANADYERAAAEHTAAKEALAGAEKALDEAKTKSDPLKAKIDAQLARLASAASALDRADAYRSGLSAQLIETEAAVKKAETEYGQSNALLSSVSFEFEAARAQAKRTLETAAEAEERYSSAVSSTDRGESRISLLNAETNLERRQSESAAAHDEMERARAVFEEKTSEMMSAKAVLDSKKAVFDKIDESFQTAEGDRIYQKGVCDRLAADLEQLDGQLEDAVSARDSAVSYAETSANELRSRSVRTSNSRYETVKIHYLQQGKGEDLLLIHSVGQSLYTFRDLISRLSSRFRVTALDLVGSGYSQKPYYFDYTISEMADFIGNFMDAMGMEYAHLFGFSMGAGYVINFARRYPERVGRLVLLNPGGITPDMPMPIKALSSRVFGTVASALISYRSVKKMLSECFFDLTNHSEALCQEYYKPLASSDAKRAVRSSVLNYDDESVIHSLRNIGTDTLLLWGTEDRWHTPEMAEMFRTVMPRVNYQPVRNAGHLAHEEKPDRVAQLIKLFIPCGYDEEEENTVFK